MKVKNGLGVLAVLAVVANCGEPPSSEPASEAGGIEFEFVDQQDGRTCVGAILRSTSTDLGCFTAPIRKLTVAPALSELADGGSILTVLAPAGLTLRTAELGNLEADVVGSMESQGVSALAAVFSEGVSTGEFLEASLTLTLFDGTGVYECVRDLYGFLKCAPA